VGAANDRLAEAEGRIGTVLRGKWRLERLLGVGGMAAVYEAQHKNHSRVAVKILHRRLGLSGEQVARFQREGYAANRVGHPGVVEVYDDDVDGEGSAFLVMELLSGQSIAERAAGHGKLDPLEVLDVAERVLDVLAAAHARGILHRDIKPENLFRTKAGELKVLDFGIARLAGTELDASSTEAGTLLGTPAFLPPEQARGLVRAVDARTDLWAVGATMFTLLTGRFVHEATTPNEQLGLAMTASARSLSELLPEAPAALVEVVDRALAYSQEERWMDAHAMQDAVRWTRDHWPEIQVSPERVPEDWSAGQPGQKRASETLGGQDDSEARSGEGPVSSTLASRPRHFNLGAIAIGMALVAAAAWAGSIVFGASDVKAPLEAPPTTSIVQAASPGSVEPLRSLAASAVVVPSAIPPGSAEAAPSAAPTPSAEAERPRRTSPTPSRRAVAAPGAPPVASAAPPAEPGDRDLYDRRY
jgi:serine/threonine protein kinase